eukprot:5977011-Amphidinium_carterae.3
MASRSGCLKRCSREHDRPGGTLRTQSSRAGVVRSTQQLASNRENRPQGCMQLCNCHQRN